MVSRQVGARVIGRSLCKCINVCPLNCTIETNTMWNVTLIEKFLKMKEFIGTLVIGTYTTSASEVVFVLLPCTIFFVCTNNYKFDKSSLKKHSLHHSPLDIILLLRKREGSTIGHALSLYTLIYYVTSCDLSI